MRFSPAHTLQAHFSLGPTAGILLLLVMVLLLTSAVLFPSGRTIHTPRAHVSVQPAQGSVVISLPDNGTILVNERRVSLEKFGTTVALALSGDTTRAVVLKTGRGVTLARSIQVIDAARAVGVTRFTIADTAASTQVRP